MPENHLKMPLSASPVARSGAGDISERELSRERHNLQSTPPARLQPVNPKKQLLFSAPAPVNKFTGRSPAPSGNLERIRSCLEDYRTQATPARPVKIGPKAVSMEDLTPAKRVKSDRSNAAYIDIDDDSLCIYALHQPLDIVYHTGKEDVVKKRPPGLHCIAEDAAAARVCRFMLVSVWRRRRGEVRCLKRTLECQVSCSERLRMQVWTLKALLDSDNAKVRLAMRELDRLKQLLKEKDIQKALLEKEKQALEHDVCEAEDRASEMSIGWRNCRNELESVRASASVCEHALSLERAASAEAREQRDDAYARLTEIEEELSVSEELLTTAEAQASALRVEAEEKLMQLESLEEQLRLEREARQNCRMECTELSARVTAATDETAALRGVVSGLQGEVARLHAELRVAREQLAWWPRPLTRLLGAARWWFRKPGTTIPDAVVWSLMPARHGC